MKITIQGKEYSKTSAICAEGLVTLEYCSADKETFRFEIKSPLEYDSTYNLEDFDIYYLLKKDVLENDIYQVYDRALDKRIGWIFPVVALDSSEHTYASNEHFTRYANVAIRKLFNEVQQDFFSIVPEVYGKASFNFSDFFHDETVLLVISKATLDGSGFRLNDWLPSLSVAGYFKLSCINPADLMLVGDRPTDKRLYLTKITPEFQGHNFVDLVYTNLIPYERHPLLFFFYCYQVIEVMLTQVFKMEQSLIYTELKKPIEDGDVVKAKDVMGKVGEINSENYRFKLLIDKYVNSPIPGDELQNACNGLLRSVNKDLGRTVSEAIYRVRNFLFHQYHSVPTSVETELSGVNTFLLKYLSDLCSNFCTRKS